jgi:hypothetical protein
VNFTVASLSPVKAWVNFNGTGTVSIRASLNVSSITDNGTGDYTVNFAKALEDANYAVCATAGDDSSNGGSSSVAWAYSYTTSSVVVGLTNNDSDVKVDSEIINVMAVR